SYKRNIVLRRRQASGRKNYRWLSILKPRVTQRGTRALEELRGNNRIIHSPNARTGYARDPRQVLRDPSGNCDYPISPTVKLPRKNRHKTVARCDTLRRCY